MESPLKKVFSTTSVSTVRGDGVVGAGVVDADVGIERGSDGVALACAIGFEAEGL